MAKPKFAEDMGQWAEAMRARLDTLEAAVSALQHKTKDTFLPGDIRRCPFCGGVPRHHDGLISCATCYGIVLPLDIWNRRVSSDDAKGWWS